MKIAQQFFQLVGGSASECGMFKSVHVSLIYHWSWSYIDWRSLILCPGIYLLGFPL